MIRVINYIALRETKTLIAKCQKCPTIPDIRNMRPTSPPQIYEASRKKQDEMRGQKKSQDQKPKNVSSKNRIEHENHNESSH